MKLFIILFIFTHSVFANSEQLINQVFIKYDLIEKLPIPDPISEEPVNLILNKIILKKKTIGFVRHIVTTTGCNSACLPVVYSSFYNEKGHLLKILSKDGLTKLYHAPFTKNDYSTLEFILTMAPKKFEPIGHPKEMTDAVSGATLKSFQDIVVKGAAYSTLRIHLYNQHTLKEIQKYLNPVK